MAETPSDDSENSQKKSELRKWISLGLALALNAGVAVFFIFATLEFADNKDGCSTCGSNWFEAMNFCSGYGSLLIVLIIVYYSMMYYYVLKPTFGKKWSAIWDFNERTNM